MEIPKTTQDIRTEFSEGKRTLKRTQDEKKMELKNSVTPLTKNSQESLARALKVK